MRNVVVMTVVVVQVWGSWWCCCWTPCPCSATSSSSASSSSSSSVGFVNHLEHPSSYVIGFFNHFVRPEQSFGRTANHLVDLFYYLEGLVNGLIYGTFSTFWHAFKAFGRPRQPLDMYWRHVAGFSTLLYYRDCQRFDRFFFLNHFSGSVNHLCTLSILLVSYLVGVWSYFQ